MRVFNFMWGFGIGGVCACFRTYCQLGAVDSRLEMINACIYLDGISSDRDVLEALGVHLIDIKGRRDLSWIGKLRDLIKDEKPDVVFAHDFNAPIAYLLARFLGAKTLPLLCTYHSEYHPMVRSRRLVAGLMNGAMHGTYRYFAKAVLGVADYNLNVLRAKRVPDTKLAYVHNGIKDLDGPLPKPCGFPSFPTGTVVFLVASRLDAIKGLSALMDAFARVYGKNPAIGLVVAGEGPERESLQRQGVELGISDRVQFVGYQTNIANWMAHCDVFCLPSYVESFPIGLVEAMRAGKTSIVSRVGGIPEAVTDREAVFINPGCVDELSQAMESLACDRGLRNDIGKRARERYLANFTVDKMMRGIADWLLAQK